MYIINNIFFRILTLHIGELNIIDPIGLHRVTYGYIGLRKLIHICIHFCEQNGIIRFREVLSLHREIFAI